MHITIDLYNNFTNFPVAEVSIAEIDEEKLKDLWDEFQFENILIGREEVNFFLYEIEDFVKVELMKYYV